MDIHTKRNLELTESIRNKERMYSLLWLLDETKTAMGGRLLKNWLENPLVNKDEIEKRYSIVSSLLENFILSEDLRKYLYNVYDLERLCGRIALGSANARDLLQLSTSLEYLPEINKLLKKINFTELPNVSDLHKLLTEALYESPPPTLKEGYLIKVGFNKELDELKDYAVVVKTLLVIMNKKKEKELALKT